MAPVKAEVRKLMTDRGIDKYTMCPVKRNYAFENPAVRHGEQWVLKLRYPASHGTLPVGLKGKVCRRVCCTRSVRDGHAWRGSHA